MTVGLSLEREGKAEREMPVCTSSSLLLLLQSTPGRDTSCSGRSGGPASHMKFSACVFWSLLAAAAMPACVGEMYTSLLNVRQAITVERRLIDHLRTYIDRELERLDDIRRWVARHAGELP